MADDQPHDLMVAVAAEQAVPASDDHTYVLMITMWGTRDQVIRRMTVADDHARILMIAIAAEITGVRQSHLSSDDHRDDDG